MKKLLVVLSLFVSVFLIVTSASQAAAQVSCVDFLAYADNDVLGNMFTINGFQFQSLGGPVPFVNVFPDIDGDQVHGAQFSNQGLAVQLPSPGNSVDVEIGVFHSPAVTIRAFDAGGGLEATVFVAADDDLHNVTLNAAVDPIVRLRFTGGGHEGVINEICD